jgi:hypothetical protein
MLPIIEIRISKICKLSLNLRTGTKGPVGDILVLVECGA